MADTVGDCVRAAACYASAMEADVASCLLPTLLGNRAQARLQEGRIAEAVEDCTQAIALDADNTKLLLRRAKGLVALKQLEKARDDYKAVLRLDPNNADAKQFVEQADMRGRRERAAAGHGGPGGAEEDDDEEDVDPYALLGVPRDANAASIKKAYRAMALKWHPDKHADAAEAERAEAEATFRLVNLANMVLNDPVKKRQYDAGGRVKDIVK